MIIDKSNIPIIDCEPREDLVGGMKFYCQYCRVYHFHGEGDGPRVSHCTNSKSPYLKTGYILKRRDGA